MNVELWQWVRFIEIPAGAGLLWFTWSSRQAAFREIAKLRGELHAHQIYALEHYATEDRLKATEERLTRHLERIEGYLKALLGEAQPCAPAKPQL